MSELTKLIAGYKIYSEKINEIIRYLYENTYLFEQKYMNDYKEELYAYFANKLTRHAREMNELNKLLTNKEKKEIQIERLLR